MPEGVQASFKGSNRYCRNDDVAVWKLRNDSSGVSGALCPEYFCETPKRISASLSNVQSSGKILIRSKGRCKEPCTEVTRRKPVKTCYCNLKSTKTKLRSPRTRRRPLLPRTGYGSEVCLRPVEAEEMEEKDVPSPTLSCETLRRVQEIDYAPRSRFLRNVQSRASLFQNSSTSRDARDKPTSPYYEDTQNFRTVDKSCKSTIKRDPAYSKEEEEEEEEEEDKCSKALHFPSRKSSRSMYCTKRTIRSRKSLPESKIDTGDSRATIAGRRREKKDRGRSLERAACRMTREGIEKSETEEDICQRYDRCVRDSADRSIDRDVRDVQKFREMNYFDTHGSCRALLSPRSSDSLEQCLLNERLFPETVGRLRRRDLVVTMPACVTTQRKRVHYFPRFVVPQEKRPCNTKYKKRRCQTCPLTGHAVDLGVLKMQPPIDSLALKYQKQRR
ncbi:hypothetical protein KM043_003757 [Ampulex compressa]|nr:hypothetical protein KM043_003757 [Ampulex compressa]